MPPNNDVAEFNRELYAIQPDAGGDVSSYASRIKHSLGKSIEAILETAEIVAEARAHLDHPRFGKLAEELGTSRGTLSKFVTIHSQRDRFDACRDTLPSAWTVMYRLSKLDDEQFGSLAASGQLQPGLSEKGVSRFVAQGAEAAGATPASDQRAYLPVKVFVPALLSPEREDDIRRKIIEAVNTEPDVTVAFSKRLKVKASRR
jgi:hypothetical protein